MTEYQLTSENAFETISKSWNPPPNLTISEWADEYGVLTAESSAEPGRWRSYTYQRAMMDAFCAPEVEQVTLLKSARIGYTKIIGHVIGYHIHQDPCSMLVIQPTIGDAEDYSKEEVQPVIDETEVLRSRVGEAKSRSSGNTITKKRYPGGILHIHGANAPRGFRRITVRIVLFDETDGYPPSAGQEGDQIELGTNRTENFWNRKIGIGSTPTVKGASRVTDSWERSDKGYFFLTCPHCSGEHIRLFREPENPILLRGEKVKVSFMHWVDDDPKSAAWMCPDCSGLIDYSHHQQMCNNGYWIGETWCWNRESGFQFESGFSGHIGFKIWAGYSYSPNSTPIKLVRRFLKAQHETELLKTFVNTVLGEAWEEKGEVANEHTLLERREVYPAEVPAGALVLTAGVDIQKDRIELEVVGWNETHESWSVDYVILPGETTQPEVWEDLAETLRGTYKHESGNSLRISGVCVDSGYLSKSVYDFILKSRVEYYFAAKGIEGSGKPIVESMTQRARRLAKRKSKKVRPELIGVDEAKTVLMRRLKIAVPGPGYCHFPIERDQEYFEQLTAEQLITRYKKGRPIREWRQVRHRNEALDNRNYAYAALLLIDPQWDRLKESIHPTEQPATPVKKEPKYRRMPSRRLIR